MWARWRHKDSWAFRYKAFVFHNTKEERMFLKEQGFTLGDIEHLPGTVVVFFRCSSSGLWSSVWCETPGVLVLNPNGDLGFWKTDTWLAWYREGQGPSWKPWEILEGIGDEDVEMELLPAPPFRQTVPVHPFG